MQAANADQQSVTGRITVVQEQCFRLVTASGQGLLFTLATNARATAGDLRRFRATNQGVRVCYTGTPALASGVAHAVELA